MSDETNINDDIAASSSKTKEKRQKNKAEQVKTKDPEKEKFVYFVSANPEEVAFDIRIAGERYKGVWDNDHEHLCWRIPAELKDRMLAHFFCVEKRIVLGE